jgi:hypothetical protein
MNDVTENPTRICRKCSVASSTEGDFCPSCGASYVRRSRRPSGKVVIIGLIGLIIVSAAVGGILIKHRNDAAAADRAEAASQRQERRAANLAEAEQTEADESERSARADLVEALEEQVTKDAKEKVADDLLEGPILYSSCTATGGGSTDDLTALNGTFECMAVNTENADGTVSGYRYSGTAEWGTGSISWRLGG